MEAINTLELVVGMDTAFSADQGMQTHAVSTPSNHSLAAKLGIELV